MCGIVAYLARRAAETEADGDAVPLLMEGLARLEYRGYDSAGLAVLDNSGAIHSRRAAGKIARLRKRLAAEPLSGAAGVGHTRWATHGRPAEHNAHPVIAAAAEDKPAVAVVHNGILENYKALREELTREGCTFATETDTEVAALLAARALAAGTPPLEAVASTLARLEGAFALAFLFAGEEDLLIGARQGSPLAAGLGEGTASLGSDVLALAPLAGEIVYLEEGDLAVLSRDSAHFYAEGDPARPVERARRSIARSNLQIGKDGHRHYMRKEIYEQPTAVGETLNGFLDPARLSAALPAFPASSAHPESVAQGKNTESAASSASPPLAPPPPSAPPGASSCRPAARPTSPASPDATGQKRWPGSLAKRRSQANCATAAPP